MKKVVYFKDPTSSLAFQTLMNCHAAVTSPENYILIKAICVYIVFSISV